MPGDAIGSMEKWERILAQEEHPSLIIGANRRVLATSAAFRARFTDGRDPAGRLCHQVLHGSRPPCQGSGGRCPLELEAGETDSVVHRHQTGLGPIYEQVTARGLSTNGDPSAAVLVVNKPLDLGHPVEQP